MSPLEAVGQFVAAINARDVPAICTAMTEDHVFTDSLGQEFRGREALRAGWTAYFAMVPDYEVRVDERFDRNGTVVLLGEARGSHTPDGQARPDRRWRTPAAWRAVVREGRVAEWRVYADNEPLRQLIAQGVAG